ncbi:MAG: protein glxC [Planctomycetes bacterium]|nr:protein glxC [Planctomycetota bacterium]
MARALQLDLAKLSVREVNQFLHDELSASGADRIEILNPDGNHSIAAGLDADVVIDILGHAGYFTAGMNKRASVTIHGNAGWSVAENIMSGVVRVKGFASESAGASGHGGLVIIEGDASSRCGISMKGCDIVVGGSVGHFSAFMAQAGTLVVCGDAGPNLGDSIYEATIYVRGKIHSLGADAQEEELKGTDVEHISHLLAAAEIDGDAREFKRIASARKLYHWNAEAHQEY